MQKASDMDLRIAKVVRLIREERGIKQLNMANALRITHSGYCRLESGKRKMTPGELFIVASELNTTVSRILYYACEEDCSWFE